MSALSFLVPTSPANQCSLTGVVAHVLWAMAYRLPEGLNNQDVIVRRRTTIGVLVLNLPEPELTRANTVSTPRRVGQDVGCSELLKRLFELDRARGPCVVAQQGP